jgi:hypothetical protein
VGKIEIKKNLNKAGICSFRMYGDKKVEERLRKFLGGSCAKCNKPLGAIIKCPAIECNHKETEIRNIHNGYEETCIKCGKNLERKFYT